MQKKRAIGTLLAINIEIKPFLWYNNYSKKYFDCLNYGNQPAQRKGEKYVNYTWCCSQYFVGSFGFLHTDGNHPVRDRSYHWAPAANLLVF